MQERINKADFGDDRTPVILNKALQAASDINKTQEDTEKEIDNIIAEEQARKNPANSEYKEGQIVTRAGKKYKVFFENGKAKFEEIN